LITTTVTKFLHAMSNPFALTQRAVVLHVIGVIYGISLAGLLLWTAGFALMVCALHADKSFSSGRERLKTALFWTSKYEGTPQTYRAAEWIIWFYMAVFLFITVTNNISDLPWDGWVFMQHTLAIAIAWLGLSAVIIARLHDLPAGQTWPQVCYHLFYRIQ
jgi:hypothetical protein